MTVQAWTAEPACTERIVLERYVEWGDKWSDLLLLRGVSYTLTVRHRRRCRCYLTTSLSQRRLRTSCKELRE